MMQIVPLILQPVLVVVHVLQYVQMLQQVLFVAAKINHFEQLPQGKIESKTRAERMINQMEEEGFGSCSNHRHCEDVCPKEISVSNIATMNNMYS